MGPRRTEGRPHTTGDGRARLRAYRRVDLPPASGGRGVDGDYLAGLVTHWADSYDWREHEARIRGLPWALTGADGTSIRAVHRRAAGADAVPVLLLRGWPDSVLRFEKVLPMLPDLHFVVSALPGFPFAAPVAGGGMSAPEMAGAVAVARPSSATGATSSPPVT